MDFAEHRQAFLDEILRDPDDDAPRLVYADFLEEQGDPRGEFIRSQIELRWLDELDDRFIDLVDRCAELLEDHHDQWARELKQDVRKTAFHRGFIDTITILAKTFAKEAPALFRSTPVNWLRFNHLKGSGPKLAEIPELSHIHCLDLARLSVPEEDLLALLKSPHLSNLRGLDLSGHVSALSDNLGATIRSSVFASSLKALRLRDTFMASGFLSSLSAKGGLPSLTNLEVTLANYLPTDAADIAQLKDSPIQSLRIHGSLNTNHCRELAKLRLGLLRTLNLRSTQVPAAGLELFAENGAFDQVSELSLGNCAIGAKALTSLFRGKQLSNCKRLDLDGFVVSRRSKRQIELFAEHEPLKQLRRLRISGLNDEELARLTRSPPLAGLEELILTNVVLGHESAAALSASPMRDSLKHLELTTFDKETGSIRDLVANGFPNLLKLSFNGGWENRAAIQDEDVEQLMASNSMPRLQSLSLDNLYLTGASLHTIARSRGFGELRWLSFDGNSASTDAVREVLDSEHLPKVTHLSIHQTRDLENRKRLQGEYGRRLRV